MSLAKDWLPTICWPLATITVRDFSPVKERDRFPLLLFLDSTLFGVCLIRLFRPPFHKRKEFLFCTQQQQKKRKDKWWIRDRETKRPTRGVLSLYIFFFLFFLFFIRDRMSLLLFNFAGVLPTIVTCGRDSLIRCHSVDCSTSCLFHYYMNCVCVCAPKFSIVSI